MKRTGLSEPRCIAHGFTLMELLLVLAIIALLAGIAVPLYFGRVDAARVQAAETDMATLATALSLYRFDNGALPSTEQGLEALRTPATRGLRPGRFREGGYIRELPLDPWGNPYRYLQPGRDPGELFSLYSLGADGKPGGEGSDADLYH